MRFEVYTIAMATSAASFDVHALGGVPGMFEKLSLGMLQCVFTHVLQEYDHYFPKKPADHKCPLTQNAVVGEFISIFREGWLG